jgi:OPA family glycerol-3-phosphate transporter-like MFS transporter
MLWAYALGQAVNGQLADRFGGRNMMALGAILSCALNWVVSFGQGLPSIALPWTANGLAQSMGWAPGSRILSNWWGKEHRGFVYGCYVFAAGSSSVVTYVMASILVGQGWRWIFRLPVLCLLFGALVFWLIARNRPADLGLPNLPLEAGEPEIAPEETAWHRYRVALSHPRFLLASLSIGFQNLARYGLIVWVPVHFLGENWKDSPDKWITVALPVGMALGAVMNGWVSDRLLRGSRGRAISVFLSCAVVAAGAMWLLPRGNPAVIPILFLTGLFVYGPQASYWALCPDLLGRRHAGTGTGIMNFFAYAFAGFGEPLIGRLIDANVLHAADHTAIIFLVVAAACLASLTLMFFARC